MTKGSLTSPQYIAKPEDLKTFDLLDKAIWVFNLESHSIWWGNTAAMEFWKVSSYEELIAKDFSEDSATVRQRLKLSYEASSRQGHVDDSWVIYPNNEPVALRLTFSPLVVGEKREKAVLIHLRRQENQGGQDEKRLLEASRYSSLMISTFDKEGSLLTQNPAAEEFYGPLGTALRNGNDEKSDFERRYGLVFKGKLMETELNTSSSLDLDACVVNPHTGQNVWHTLRIRKGRDPITAGPLFVITEEDITVRIESLNRLHSINNELEIRVEEKTADLAAALERAESANLAKTQFLASVSHELRTPLNAIIGFSEAMLYGVYGKLEERQSEILQSVHERGRDLLHLINDLLDASALESRKVKINSDPIELRCFLSQLQDTLEIICKPKNQGFTCVLPPEGIILRADEQRIRQALINLVENAAKYTPDHGRIAIEVQTAPQQILLHVLDTGVGIPENKIESVKTAFTQVRENGLAASEGVGLGLYIVNQIMQAHGGELRIESKSGQGSNVTLVFPQQNI
ncbi:sensor histidine kinase [Kiloniella sp. b19]|uniref:sensor histidine kinase n=1 Tax=Kiloniella sp. GXU_MW_B19 TaxID=3141326 RepID=UPI0031D77622